MSFALSGYKRVGSWFLAGLAACAGSCTKNEANNGDADAGGANSLSASSEAAPPTSSGRPAESSTPSSGPTGTSTTDASAQGSVPQVNSSATGTSAASGEPGQAGAGGQGAGGQGAGAQSSAGTDAGPSDGTDGGGEPAMPSGACALTPERVRITEIDVGLTVLVNEEEAALRPLVISAIPGGGSRLAWMGNGPQLHVATLDAQDQPQADVLTLPANDFADLYADDQGGVLLLTRDAQGAGERHCGTLTNLCGNVDNLPDQAECWDMYLVRFDGSSETWATQLTDSAADKPPYLAGPTDTQRSIYIWDPYAHHGRIAFDGSNYAGYFGAAISVSETCVQPDTSQAQGVNIHQGDRMNVVSSTGELLEQGFDWGCSHSGYERVLWDPDAQRFVPVCKTDNNNRLALAPHYSTIRSVDLAANNISDLVLDGQGGYWLLASDAESAGYQHADVKLLRFSITDDEASLDEEINVASEVDLNERAPYLAAYGSDSLLVGWESSPQGNDLRATDGARQMHMQVRDRATGAAVGDAIPVNVPGNRYHSLRSFPDGSVALPAAGSTTTKLNVLRVLPCAP